MDSRKSIYFHIPFCIKRCTYCDFTTYSGIEKWIPTYFHSLEKEVALAAGDEFIKPKIHTIFFGGGTPSIVTAGIYDQLLKVVRNNFDLDDDLEMSLEANPGTIQDKDLSEYRKMGFNRISLGVQSFHPRELQLLGRIHDNRKTLSAIKGIRSSGFNNLNLDLIYGLPGQSRSDWKESLQKALDLEPEHLSLYCLTIEEGTPLAESVKSGETIPIDDDISADMFELAMEELAAVGYRHYEISNWAKVKSDGKDYRCRHNLQYWRNEEYYGFGAGAHGYNHNMRVANTGNIPQFIKLIMNGSTVGSARIEQRETSPFERMQDEMMLRLRLIDEGVTSAWFSSKFGCEMTEIFSEQITGLIERDLLQWKNGNESTLVLTKRGILLGNQVFMEFVGSN
jgi:oxygen-independent coproporphyrinogen-3 oxidase